MSIDRQHGKIVFICDGGCGDSVETGRGDWDAAFAKFLEEPGWRAGKDGDVWKHFCRECAQASPLRLTR